MKYKKRPVVVDTVQWTGENPEEIVGFVGVSARIWEKQHEDDVLDILTLEGVMRAQTGDWIIKGVEGEFYPCNERIFHATYEKVENDE